MLKNKTQKVYLPIIITCLFMISCMSKKQLIYSHPSMITKELNEGDKVRIFTKEAVTFELIITNVTTEAIYYGTNQKILISNIERIEKKQINVRKSVRTTAGIGLVIIVVGAFLLALTLSGTTS